MRLYLSSYGLGERATELRARTDQARAAVILNALDLFGTSRHRDLQVHLEALTSLGYDASELDLRHYFSPPERLAEVISDLELIWAVGGNTFVLARAMHQARMAAALAPHRDNHALTYGGFSADACVAAPGLSGIDLMDDAEVVPPGYPESAEACALGLAPFRVVPHWRSEHPETAAAELAAAYMSEQGLAHRCLRDGEVIVLTLRN